MIPELLHGSSRATIKMDKQHNNIKDAGIVRHTNISSIRLKFGKINNSRFLKHSIDGFIATPWRLNEMVNEIGDKLEEKNEKEPWTINLGKHFSYNPSPFMDKDDLVRKTVIIILIIAIGIAILYYAPSLQIFGILIIGSALFCYVLSFYETNLLEKRTKHELK
jgi:hypothetical protein